MPLSYFACTFCGVGVEVVEMMLGTRTLSSWKSERLDTRRRVKSFGAKRPSRSGAVNAGHRRWQVERKERMSWPECLERVSHTTPQYRLQKSLVSLASFPSSSPSKGVLSRS